ncbi:hypothetical protein ACWGI8_33305 [Streptomyces sp. NPDC054841]
MKPCPLTSQDRVCATVNLVPIGGEFSEYAVREPLRRDGDPFRGVGGTSRSGSPAPGARSDAE